MVQFIQVKHFLQVSFIFTTELIYHAKTVHIQVIANIVDPEIVPHSLIRIGSICHTILFSLREKKHLPRLL